MHRLFVAIDLPDALRRQLAFLESGIRGARWVAPEQLHLTLRFIGEIDGAQFEELRWALGQIEADAFDLVLSGFGHFPTRGAPHTLWVGVAPNPVLSLLRVKINSVVAGLRLPCEERNYYPHVALARLKGARATHVAAYIADHGVFVAPAFTVDEFLLYQSFLGAGGAVHRVEVGYPLRPRALANGETTAPASRESG
ncbi:MAG: RNA 2',3'-cyclic phosphodiesterase [Alphaproteobacteria bacterium]|nr:RNA 2',3'-cyclic phosphodiesterase [Alphaproteobacteria bacterium]